MSIHRPLLGSIGQIQMAITIDDAAEYHLVGLARLFIDFEQQILRIMKLRNRQDALIVLGLLLVEDAGKELPTASNVSRLIGMARRTVQERLVFLDQVNKVIRVESSGPAPFLYYVNRTELHEWYESGEAQEVLARINETLIGTVKHLLPLPKSI